MYKTNLLNNDPGAIGRSGNMRALIAVAMAALVAFCVLVEKPAKAQTLPTVVDFGDLLVGSTENQLVTITNPSANLEVTLELLGDGSFTFADPATGNPVTEITLDPNETVELQVTFAPTSAGPQDGLIDLSLLGIDVALLTNDALLEIIGLDGSIDFAVLAGLIDRTNPATLAELDAISDLTALEILALDLNGLIELLEGLTDAQLLELLLNLTPEERSTVINLGDITLGEVTIVGVGTSPPPPPPPTPVANTAPQVSVDQPAKKKIKGRNPTIIGTATDAQEDLDKADIRVSLKGKNGKERTTSFTYDQATDKVQFVSNKKLKKGKKYVAKITATDAQGLSTSAEKTFKVKKRN